MTVAELINYLMKQDPTLRVLIPGYEAGYTDIKLNCIEICEVTLDILRKPYYGEHVRVGSHIDSLEPGFVRDKALIFHRNSEFEEEKFS